MKVVLYKHNLIYYYENILYEDVNSLFFNNKNILEKSYKEELENN